MARIDAFLDLVVKQKGSDLHLIAGNPPRLRLNGEMYPVKYRELSSDETYDLLMEIMPELAKENYKKTKGADFAYEAEGMARFRVNVFQHLSGIGAVFRVIPTDIQSLAQLQLPPALKSIARNRKGLILVTGPTGSGKSTTLAAIIDFINQERKGHIITIEDPIEFIHENKNCLMSQREVGTHTEHFSHALHSALREDPNVILVGELRDLETMQLAVTAAEMGILVMATLHTSSASSTVDRIINVFPPEEEAFIRSMLSTSLCAVVSQLLLKTADNKGRVAAVEIMINNPAISNCIREGKTEQIENIIQSGAMQGMQRMDTAIRRLLEAEKITGEEAYAKAHTKGDFAHFLDNFDEPAGDDDTNSLTQTE